MKSLVVLLALTAGVQAQEQPFRVEVTGSGEPMILIPGLASSGEVWESTVAHYRDRYQCHMLTLAGFAGVPRVPELTLEDVRDALASYVKTNKLHKPVIVGHSLGGYLALTLASKYPDMPGKLVIVDSAPFLAGVVSPGATPEEAQKNAATMRQYMQGQSQEQYERYTKSGVSTRPMVSKESDLERVIGWGLKSDRTAVADALAELFARDLRDEIAAIRCPTLAFGTWIGYKQYTDRARTEANLRRQYAKLPNVEIRITDTASHFLMWDDPDWMFGHMDGFLTGAKVVEVR